MDHLDEICQDLVRRMNHGEQTLGNCERGYSGGGEGGEGYLLHTFHLLFHNSSVKHSHSIYKTGLFLLDVRP